MAIPEEVQKKIDEKLNGKAEPSPEEVVRAEMEKVPTVPDAPKEETPVTTAEAKPPPKVKEYIDPPKSPTDEKKECVKKIGEILARYNYQESNIPQNENHPDFEYWNLVNRYKSL